MIIMEIIAIKKEEDSKWLYAELAKMSFDEDIKKVFLRLSEEESKHKFSLQTVYDDTISSEN